MSQWQLRQPAVVERADTTAKPPRFRDADDEDTGYDNWMLSDEDDGMAKTDRD